MPKPKRPIEDEEDHSPPSKRARLEEQATLESIPVELRAMILQELVDKNDAVATLGALDAYARASRSSRDSLAFALGDLESVWKISQGVRRSTNRLDEFGPHMDVATTRRDARLSHLASEADSIPLRTAERRKLIVDDIFSEKKGSLDREPFLGLASNLDFLDGVDQTRIVNEILTHCEKNSEEFQLVKLLTSQAECLTSAQRSKLVATSCAIGNEDDRADVLRHWARKMEYLDPTDQGRIFSSITDDASNVDQYLVEFARHAGKLSPIQKKEIVPHVVEIPPTNPSRLVALSYLAANIEHFDRSEAAIVVGAVVKAIRDQAEDQAEDAPTEFSRPGFCLVEAVRSVARSKALKSSPEADREAIENFIQDTISRRDPDALAAKVQLIDLIKSEEVKQEIYELIKPAAKQNWRALYAFSKRVESLSAYDRLNYIHTLFKTSDRFHHHINEITFYIMDNNLSLFDKADQKRIACFLLKRVRYLEPHEAKARLALISRNTHVLSHTDIIDIIEKTHYLSDREIGRSRQDEDAAHYARAYFLNAMRTVGRWFETEITKTKYNANNLVHVSRNYDQRPRSTSVAR